MMLLFYVSEFLLKFFANFSCQPRIEQFPDCLYLSIKNIAITGHSKRTSALKAIFFTSTLIMSLFVTFYGYPSPLMSRVANSVVQK